MKNKSAFIALTILLVVVIIFGALYSIDFKMMEEGKPVVFSTWGQKYTHVENEDAEKIKETIVSYIIKRESAYSNYYGEKWFCVPKIYLISRDDELYNAYAWIYAASYIKQPGGELQERSAFSVPHKFVLTKENDEFKVLKCETPGDGVQYPIDMEKLFPKNVLTEMDKVQHDGTIAELETEIQKQIAQFYN